MEITRDVWLNVKICEECSAIATSQSWCNYWESIQENPICSFCGACKFKDGVAMVVLKPNYRWWKPWTWHDTTIKYRSEK